MGIDILGIDILGIDILGIDILAIPRLKGMCLTDIKVLKFIWVYTRAGVPQGSIL